MVPQCVRPGCDDLQPPSNGELEYSYEGALVTFRCNSELILNGEPVLGCDGQYWNSTVPQCVEPKTSSATANYFFSFKKSYHPTSTTELLLLLQTIMFTVPVIIQQFVNQVHCIP